MVRKFVANETVVQQDMVSLISWRQIIEQKQYCPRLLGGAVVLSGAVLLQFYGKHIL